MRTQAILLCAVATLAALSPADADDHGNDCASATPVAIGSVTGGIIDYQGDLDVFGFTVTNTANYVIYTRGTTDTYGKLYPTTCSSLIAADNNSGEDANFRIVYNLTPGTYYVEVSLSSGFVNPLPYELHIEGPGAGTVSDDHGFSPWSATPVAVGSMTAGVIDTEGDLDFFAFTVTSTATYVIYTRGATDTYGAVYDSAYGLVTFDDNSGENNNFRMVRTLSPGTYYVQVSLSGGFVNPVPYELHIEGPGAGTVSDDHGFSPWSATPVAVGSMTAGVIDTEGDLDFFAFTVTSTATYVIYTRGATDTYGAVYDSAYGLVTFDDNSGENNNFRMVRTLSPGTYYVQVSLSGGFVNPVPYELHIEGPGAGTVSDDHGFSPWSATPVAVGSMTAGVIDTEGDLDFFAFTVTSTATYVIYTRGATDT